MNIDAQRWRRQSQLFDELVEADATTRAQRLLELAAQDRELAEALQRMLEADQQALGLLDQGLGRDTLGAIAGEAHSPADRSATQIDDYRLERLLGRGGMGEVYLATRMATGYEQRVAVKLLRRGVDTGDALKRFAQERRILARLQHPNIARLIDGGVSGDGQPYLVVELVDGLTITAHAEGVGLDVDQRLRLLQTACVAVDYAHRHLVIHRDLKPSNILVDADGTLKLLDFGIAKLLDPDEEQQVLTGSAVRALSPAYAAPEQILGEAIGTAADVYALGVVLYELLTGQLPHRRRSANFEQLAQGLVSEQVQAPSLLLRELARSGAVAPFDTARRARRVQGDLDTIVLKALAREPERRYGSAQALAEDLERFLAGRPIAARPDTVRYRINRFVRRHRGAVAASLVTLLALVIGIGLALWQAQLAQQQAMRADREAKRAEAEAKSALEMTARSKRVKDFLISIFVQEDPLRRDVRAPLTLAEAFDDALRRIDSELAGDPALQGDLLDDFGEIVTNKGDFERAQPLFERALASAEKVHGPDDPAVAESLVNLAVLANIRGHGSEGKPLLQRAVAILERGADSDPLALANALSALGAIEHDEGHLAESIKRFRRVVEIDRKFGKLDSQSLAALTNLGGALTDAGEYAEAESLLRGALADSEKLYGEQAPVLIPVLRLLSSLSFQQGRLAEECALEERALALSKATYPNGHPWTAGGLTETGWCLARDKRFVEGEQRMREALAMYAKLGDTDHELAGTWRRLAMSQRQRKDNVAALQSLEEAWRSCKGADIERGKMCLTVRANRAQMLAVNGQAELALQEADAAIAGLVKGYGEVSDERTQGMDARAAALEALGRSDEARQMLRDSQVMTEKVYGAQHFLSARAAQAVADFDRRHPPLVGAVK